LIPTTLNNLHQTSRKVGETAEASARPAAIGRWQRESDKTSKKLEASGAVVHNWPKNGGNIRTDSARRSSCRRTKTKCEDEKFRAARAERDFKEILHTMGLSSEMRVRPGPATIRLALMRNRVRPSNWAGHGASHRDDSVTGHSAPSHTEEPDDDGLQKAKEARSSSNAYHRRQASAVAERRGESHLMNARSVGHA